MGCDPHEAVPDVDSPGTPGAQFSGFDSIARERTIGVTVDRDARIAWLKHASHYFGRHHLAERLDVDSFLRHVFSDEKAEGRIDRTGTKANRVAG